MTECRLEISESDWCDIRHCEAVIVREYESKDGQRLARAVAWGDYDEMKEQAETPMMFVVPVGFHIIGQQAIRVDVLLR